MYFNMNTIKSDSKESNSNSFYSKRKKSRDKETNLKNETLSQVNPLTWTVIICVELEIGLG